MDRTPIGENVVLLDPVTLTPLRVVLIDPSTLEVNDAHPPILRDERYRQELEEARAAGQLRISLTALTDGFLLDGHRRRAIALELGLATVPVCFLDGKQAQALFGTYSRRERRYFERHAHGRLMLERIERLVRRRGLSFARRATTA